MGRIKGITLLVASLTAFAVTLACVGCTPTQEKATITAIEPSVPLFVSTALQLADIKAPATTRADAAKAVTYCDDVLKALAVANLAPAAAQTAVNAGLISKVPSWLSGAITTAMAFDPDAVKIITDIKGALQAYLASPAPVLKATVKSTDK